MEKLQRTVEILETQATAYSTSLVAAETAPLNNMLDAYWHVKELHARAIAALRELNKQLERMSKMVIPTKMDDLGLDLARIPELGRSFYPVAKFSASMADKDAGHQWLRENGGGDLIQPTVNASALASFLKDMVLEEGIEPPEAVMKLNQYRITGSSKYTPK